MARIFLSDEYVVDSDPMCFVLKYKKPTRNKKTKELTGKTIEELVGYYRDLESLLDAMVRDRQQRFTEDFKGDIHKWMETIKSINEKAVVDLEAKMNAGLWMEMKRDGKRQKSRETREDM